MNKVVKGVIAGAVGGGAIAWYRAYRNGETAQDATVTAAKTGVVYGAAGGLVVGVVLQRRSRATLSRKAAAQARMRDVAGQVAAAAVAAGELARPAVERAVEQARPHAKRAWLTGRKRALELADRARPGVEQAAGWVSEHAKDAAAQARPALEQAAAQARPLIKDAADRARALAA